MKTRRLAMLALAVVLASAGPSLARRRKPQPVQVHVVNDRAIPLYKLGEPATFSITVTDHGKPVTKGEVLVTVTYGMGRRILTEKRTLGEKPITVTQTLKAPGFVHCRGMYTVGKERYYGDGAAGFDALAVQPGQTLPKDFTAFWEAGRAELAKIPLDLKLKPLPKYTNDRVAGYEISFANINGTRMYGLLAVPKKGKGPYPVDLRIPGASVSTLRRPPTRWAYRGVIGLVMSVHDFPTDLPKEELAKQKKRLTGYQWFGIPDRKQYYFYRVILGLDRALDYLASRPDVDRKRIVVNGSSQGGGLSLIMAGLNKHVTAAAANHPALCDHAAKLKGRRPGWPAIVARARKRRKEGLAMSAYYDVVNFSRFIHCPTLIAVGFVDAKCSPSVVYAAYNQIKAPKEIINEPHTGHSWNPATSKRLAAWVDARLGL